MIKVVAGVITLQDKVLIARRAPHKKMPGKWEFPGGKVEPDESDERALEREIFEEFGVRIKTGSFLARNQYDYGEFEIELIAYHAEYVEGDFSLSDHDRIQWVRPEQLGRFDLTEADVIFVEKLQKGSE
jgi:8-oxo-dGTP diphosphatase